MALYIFAFIILIHGLIHFMGFAKAFGYGNMSGLKTNISGTLGYIWFTTAFLFVAVVILILFKYDYWWVPGFIAVIFSQSLIIRSWVDSKFGTIANVILLIAVVIGYGTWHFAGIYHNDVASNIRESNAAKIPVLTLEDIQYLPEPVKKYIIYTGAIGKPQVKNFKIEFSGNLRKNDSSEWMPFNSEQYNFLDASTRLFFLKATMKHLPVTGYHKFNNGSAFMDIRLFSLFNVQYQTGKEMGIAETVTFFNDMCCLAPATLIDKRIKWLETNGNNVRAEFTNNNITISALLLFNEKGELVNFVSGDRFAVTDDGSLKNYQWSTPLKDYREINGYKIASYADAVYKYPEGDFTYGNFSLTGLQYNCTAE